MRKKSLIQYIIRHNFMPKQELISKLGFTKKYLTLNQNQMQTVSQNKNMNVVFQRKEK